MNIHAQTALLTGPFRVCSRTACPTEEDSCLSLSAHTRCLPSVEEAGGQREGAKDGNATCSIVALPCLSLEPYNLEPNMGQADRGKF